MTHKERFLPMQASCQKRTPAAIADSSLVREHLAGEPDTAFLDRLASAAEYPVFDPDIRISPAEVKECIRDLRGQFHAERADLIMEEIKSDLTRTVVGPCGLGPILAAYDKTGGNVNTVHNVRKGIHATDREEKAYENREAYDSSSVYKNARYKEANRETTRRQKSDAGVEDIYTGNPLKGGANKDLDHVKSAKETHDDPARVLAELTTEDLANMAENLGVTNQTINRSKGAKSIDEFIKKVPRKTSNLEKKIANLEAKGDLNRDDADKLRKLKARLKHFRDFDPKRARKADQKARRAQDKRINRKYYTSKKFAMSTASAAALEGGRMGLQQAIGLIVIEFLAACFDETKRVIASAAACKEVFPEFKNALGRIKDRLVGKWRDVLSAFASGCLSGFLSSLATTLINVFKTTGKRVVRMIREGAFSFFGAMKVALFPQDGQSYAQSFHAASKLLFSGAVVIGGIILEDLVEKAVVGFLPFLSVLAAPLVAAIVAGISTLAVALGCYILDKLDMFGAVKLEEDRFVQEQLDERIARHEGRWRAEVDKLAIILRAWPKSPTSTQYLASNAGYRRTLAQHIACCGRNVGYPTPPAQIPACPLRHEAPTSGD